MRVCTFYYSDALDSTKCNMNEDFNNLSPLSKLDALKDCIGILNEAYGYALKEFSVEYNDGSKRS
jgi:hypothetical protein